MKIEFTKSSADEAEILSDLAIESKGYWGYSKEDLDMWRKDLRISPEYIEQNTVRTIWGDSDRLGFFAIQQKEENILDHLWLRPNAIGKGLGAEAFQEIVRECSDLGIQDFIIVSDPHAEGFYLHQGAVRIGKVESIPQNRFLPKLRYTIGNPTRNQSEHIQPDKARCRARTP